MHGHHLFQVSSGNKYYLLLLDDFTHYTWTCPPRCKSNVFPLLAVFRAYVYTQFRLPIVAFQPDNGREFDSVALRTFFSKHGIHFWLPILCQQNGKSELSTIVFAHLPLLLISSQSASLQGNFAAHTA